MAPTKPRPSDKQSSAVEKCPSETKRRSDHASPSNKTPQGKSSAVKKCPCEKKRRSDHTSPSNKVPQGKSSAVKKCPCEKKRRNDHSSPSNKAPQGKSSAVKKCPSEKKRRSDHASPSNKAPQGESSTRKADRCENCSGRRTGENSEETLNRSTPKVPPTWFNSPEQENLRRSFLFAINKRRNRLSLPPVTLEPLLNDCAANHNYDQAFNMNWIYHKSSDGSKLSDRLKKVGYAYSWAGENVAYGYETVEWVVNSLMKSPGHRKNIVKKEAKEMGVHGGVGADGHWYWTQVLAAPKQ